MKTFLAVFTGSPASPSKARWDALDDEAKKSREQAGMTGWMEWAKQHETSIVDGGAPLGKTKQINANGISDTKNNLAGYTIVRADSYDTAAKMFENHPHFKIFPGDAVEIMECLSIPGM